MNDRGIGSNANAIESAESANLFTKHGNYPVKRINDFESVVQKDHNRGIEIPIHIYADDTLVSFMASDRTIDQAANVTTLPRVLEHVPVLPDGHEGYGFPVGGG
jgi:tRNA-splicing ligase RtcB